MFFQILQEGGGRVDVMHFHIGKYWNLGCTWDEAEQHYRDIMRDPARVNFITMFREPREHLLSFYYYFIAPYSRHVS